MNLMRRRVFAGCTLDQEVMVVTDPKDGDIRKARPKLRFKDEAQRARHRVDMARRRFIRKFNATFRAGDLYATLTVDDAHEIHTFAEARRVRDAYWRRLRRACHEAAIVIVMGRGKSTSRIHFHLVAQGVPEEVIRAKWTWGMVLEPIRVLREHNYYLNKDGRKVDHGQDFRGLAAYLFDHWTEEQGGHYYKGTRNMDQPDREKPEEYRADTPYYASRFARYEGREVHVRLRNGYRADSPTMECVVIPERRRGAKPEWGGNPEELCWVLKIAAILWDENGVRQAAQKEE